MREREREIERDKGATILIIEDIKKFKETCNGFWLKFYFLPLIKIQFFFIQNFNPKRERDFFK